MLSWDALTALSTAVTALVIGVTAVVGYRQIRLAGAQLEHLRRTTQLQGTMVVFDEMTSAQASRILIQGGVRRDKRNEKVDKMAAAILLQSYLDGKP